MASVDIVKSDSSIELRDEINKRIANKEVTDIKFCVNAKIHSPMGGGSYSNGEEYYAMIIYKNWGKAG